HAIDIDRDDRHVEPLGDPLEGDRAFCEDADDVARLQLAARLLDRAGRLAVRPDRDRLHQRQQRTTHRPIVEWPVDEEPDRAPHARAHHRNVGVRDGIAHQQRRPVQRHVLPADDRDPVDSMSKEPQDEADHELRQDAEHVPRLYAGQRRRVRVQPRVMAPLTRLPGSIACAVAAVLASTLCAGALPPAAAHPGEYAPADIAYGARLYDAQCVTCHGANGDGVGGVDLKSGRFRNGTTDQDLARIITTGIQGTGMLAFKFDPAEVTGVIAFLRNMNTFDRGSVKPGDAARGRAVFDGKGRCGTCHRVDGQGPRAAPDLSDVGANRSAGSLMRPVLEPWSQMMPINRPVRAVRRDGSVVNGRRLNEDTYTVQLIDDRERLVSLLKADLREYTILTTSPMPSYRGTL